MNIKKIKNKGFTLLELLLVLSIAGFLGTSLMKYDRNKTQFQRAEKAGEQMSTVGKALASYINREMPALSTNIPNGGTITLVGDVLRGGNETVGGAVYQGHQILPPTFSLRNVLGPMMVIQINNRDGSIEGLVVTSSAICEQSTGGVPCGASNPIKYDWIGSAMKAIGPMSGVTFGNASLMTGYNSGWTETSTRFNGINAAGLLGYRVFGTSAGEYDNIYLRLDGTSVMRGNLNMGNYNINNAATVTANDWMRTDSLLANTVRAGNIFASQNVEAMDASFSRNAFIGNDMWVARDIGAGRDMVATNDVSAYRDVNAARNLNVGQNANVLRDMFIGGNTSVNGWLLTQGDLGTMSNLWVRGTASIVGDLGVEGRAWFQNDVTMTRNLGVGGNVSVTQDLGVGRNMWVVGNQTVNQNLTVGGRGTFNNGVVSGANVEAAGNGYFGGSISTPNNVTAGNTVSATNSVNAGNTMSAGNSMSAPVGNFSNISNQLNALQTQINNIQPVINNYYY